MIFNSIAFLVFIVFFFLLYFNVKGKTRLWLMLVGSYFFYGWWDWRFLSLIAISTGIDYLMGIKLGGTEDARKRKLFLTASMVMNLGFLGFFKYFNFFLDSSIAALDLLGLGTSIHTLKIILPVGISFYTFQSMSYTIDVYFKKIPVERNLIKFATYISFFPQLVAGPIVRASDFLPQFTREIKWDSDRFVRGTTQVLWGFFKKVAIADSLAPFVDEVYFDPVTHSSAHLMLGVVFYSFQIYCDFSGYSDIAIGLARIMGFDFPDNFKTPYFSRGFSEFWTRWHITLSSWLRDYLYIPLGGNRNGTFNTYRNLMLTMLLGGLWHGASWVFVFWGFLHGMYLVVERLAGKSFGNLMRRMKLPKWVFNGVNIMIVYFWTNVAWVFFRSPDFQTAMEVFQGIASLENFDWANVTNKFWVVRGVILISILLFIEITQIRVKWNNVVLVNPVIRVTSYAVLLWLIAFFGTFGANAFIYFQF